MILVRLPTPLRALTGGRGDLQVEAATVAEAIGRLDEQYAGLRDRLCEADGSVRRFLNVYLNDEDIRFLRGTATPLTPGDQLTIVPAMAGGAPSSGRAVLDSPPAPSVRRPR